MRAICLLAIALSGCAAIQQAPSLKYCDRVSYERAGREITITAHCFEAIESTVIAVPALKP